MQWKWEWKHLYWCFMIIMMLVIFVLSHQQGDVSLQVSEKIASTLQVEPDAYYGDTATSVQPLFAGLNLRKYAHVVLYALLGLSVFLVTKDGKAAWWKKLLVALLICFVYSVTDEIHQSLVPGRTARMMDIWIDAFGYTIIIIVSWGIQCIRGRVSTK